MLENEDRDNIYYSVRQGARLITGYDGLPSPASPVLPGQPIRHRDAVYRDMEIRLAALARRIYGAAEPVAVEVAETTNGRRRLERGLLFALAVLKAPLIALSAGVIWIAVGRGLASLMVLARAAPGMVGMDRLPPAGRRKSSRHWSKPSTSCLTGYAILHRDPALHRQCVAPVAHAAHNPAHPSRPGASPRDRGGSRRARRCRGGRGPTRAADRPAARTCGRRRGGGDSNRRAHRYRCNRRRGGE